MRSITPWILTLATLSLLPLPAAVAYDWQTITGCRLIENEANDGDSFHVAQA